MNDDAKTNNQESDERLKARKEEMRQLRAKFYKGIIVIESPEDTIDDPLHP